MRRPVSTSFWDTSGQPGALAEAAVVSGAADVSAELPIMAPIPLRPIIPLPPIMPPPPDPVSGGTVSTTARVRPADPSAEPPEGRAQAEDTRRRLAAPSAATFRIMIVLTTSPPEGPQIPVSHS